MASIARRPDGQWRARYRDATGKEHARHFPRRFDAQRWLDETTAAVVTGQYVDPKSARTTLDVYAAGWESSQIGRAATARLVDNALRLHILPRFGQRPIASIRPSDVQAFVKAMSLTYAAGTVRNVYDFLARLMSAAVDDRLIASSPCRRIVLPRDDDVEIAPPAVSDVVAIAGAVPARYRAGVVMLAGSGLRIGELLGLRIIDVDFLRRTVRVDRQRLQDGSIGPVKTPKSARTVPLGQVVIDELAAHLATYAGEEWLLTTDRGGYLGYRTWRSVWTAAHSKLQRAEDQLAATEGRKPALVPKVGTHDLRHFYASALIAGGSLGQASSSCPRTFERGNHAADLCAPLARRRRPHPVRSGRRTQPPANQC